MRGLRILVRALIAFLAVLAGLALLAAIFKDQVAEGVRWIITAPPLFTPPAPTILVPRGPMPTGAVGLQQWLQVPGGSFTAIQTSGFLLKLPSGEVIGVTTAHSLFAEDPHRQLARVALGVNGQSAPAAEADVYYGPPGQPFARNDFAMDYVLLKVGAADPALALEPDPRDLAQPGERVTLFSGLGDGQGGADPRGGTVLSAGPEGIVILMDETDFNPAGMSGSPVVSQTTGRVVGMAIGAALYHTRWEIGLHPIRHLLQTAESAREFPRIADFRR